VVFTGRVYNGKQVYVGRDLWLRGRYRAFVCAGHRCVEAEVTAFSKSRRGYGSRYGVLYVPRWAIRELGVQDGALVVVRILVPAEVRGEAAAR